MSCHLSQVYAGYYADALERRKRNFANADTTEVRFLG